MYCLDNSKRALYHTIKLGEVIHYYIIKPGEVNTSLMKEFF